MTQTAIRKFEKRRRSSSNRTNQPSSRANLTSVYYGKRGSLLGKTTRQHSAISLTFTSVLTPFRAAIPLKNAPVHFAFASPQYESSPFFDRLCTDYANFNHSH